LLEFVEMNSGSFNGNQLHAPKYRLPANDSYFGILHLGLQRTWALFTSSHSKENARFRCWT